MESTGLLPMVRDGGWKAAPWKGVPWMGAESAGWGAKCLSLAVTTDQASLAMKTSRPALVLEVQ